MSADSLAKKATYQRKWRAKNREAARNISRIASQKYNSSNPDAKRKSARDYMRRKRSEVLSFFGCKCVRCGFDDPRALHMDHINGGGFKARKSGETQNMQWRRVRDNPEHARAIYQLLCANCNCIKREENQEKSTREPID
jgi:hypothetical protein